MKKTLTVIDTFGFFFRSFYALPPLKNSNDFPTGLLTGFINFIGQITKEHSSDYLIFALDAKGKSFRSQIDENYKAHRKDVPQDLLDQLPIAIEWIEKMGFSSLSQKGFEADDIIATATRLAKEQEIDVRIVSHDKDLYQLIDDGRVIMVDAIKRKEINESVCIEKFGVKPEQFIDYQSLIGDSADNISGVKGVGPKTAQRLFAIHHNLNTIYKEIDTVTPPRIQNLLREHREDAFRSRELVTLRSDVYESLPFENFTIPSKDPLLNIIDELKKYEMHNALRRIDQLSSQNEIKEADNIDEFETFLLNSAPKLFKIIDAIDESAIVAIDTETTGLDVHSDKLVGFSFSVSSSAGYYVPIAHNYLGVLEQINFKDAKKALIALLSKRVIGHNLKFDLALLYRVLEIEPILVEADTMILAWLVNPEQRVGLDKLALSMLNHEMISFKDTVKRGETFASVAVEDAAKYAAEDAVITYRLYTKLKTTLERQNAKHLLQEAKRVEFPFINTLIGMESRGILVDIEFYERLKDESVASLELLTKRIYELAQSEFNINSTKQLGALLFEKLGLRVVKRTKTGYSTDESVLSELKDEHPIVNKILDYRELFKLHSTYIEPLLKLGKDSVDSRVHTSFIQTGTSTGRLSSKNPNLQNIPVKSEAGRKIRDGFIAEKGKKLISIDYSQIELRLLAHFSQDEVLLNAFKSGADIHYETARKLFGEDTAKENRSIAKSVNFGLLYGMGSKKLSQTLDISTKEAKNIIDKYFDSFPTVKNYFAAVVQGAETKGFVETLNGRRRYFDFKRATPMQLAAYKRESVNTLFQGSAADIVKAAMLKIDEVIKKEHLLAQTLLQIHDELIIEVSDMNAEALSIKFAKIMENIVSLNVPLKCSVYVADSWGELK